MIFNQIVGSDAHTYLSKLPAASVNCIVTSPPYFGLRDYGIDGQVGKESHPDQYICNLVRIFGEAKRVLRNDGTLWLNLGDSYSNQGKQGGKTSGLYNHGLHGKRTNEPANYGRPAKNLLMIPARVAIALQDDGWILRSEIIWVKPNCMPSSAKDRPTVSHEKIYLLSKKKRYFYNLTAGRTPIKPESAARLKRGVSEGHKHTGGAGGQRPHTMHQARTNDGDRDIADTANLRDLWTIATAKYEGGAFCNHAVGAGRAHGIAGLPTWGRCAGSVHGCRYHCPSRRQAWARVSGERDQPGVSGRSHAAAGYRCSSIVVRYADYGGGE